MEAGMLINTHNSLNIPTVLDDSHNLDVKITPKRILNERLSSKLMEWVIETQLDRYGSPLINGLIQ